MAFAVADRVKETSTTTGTGTLNLAGAEPGYQTFVAGIGNGNTTYYAIVNRATSEFEVGIGTVTDAATDTLSRDTIISSSNGGSAVNFSAGTKDVICTLPSEKSYVLDNAGDTTISADLSVTSISGSGAGLTSLNASNVSSGTLDDARLTANVTLNNASTISAGTLADARLTSNVTLNNASTISTGTLPNARLSAVPNSALENSAITINGSGVSLGGSINVGDIEGVTAGNGLTGGGTTGTVTLNVGAGNLIDVTADAIDVDLSELTTSTSDADGDFFAVVDSANAQKKLTKGNINISGFNNDAGYTTNVGDITGVTAGSGLTGGGASGSVTLNVGAGTGIDVAADSIAVDVSDFMSNGSNNRVVTATGTDAMNAEANMTFDGSLLTVTGTIDATNISVNSGGNVTNPIIFVQSDTNTGIFFPSADTIAFSTGAGERLRIDSSGIDVTGAITATGDITAFFTSDETLKTNIANIENPMEKVAQLNGVSYNWTDEAQTKYPHLNGDKEVGVIAQQVEKVLPQMVALRPDGTKGVRYERMCALLIECIKDLQDQVNELKKGN